uniref:Uncharacterized protein n=1 Tax=Triticum urartu TaxID=4572 RepID=A0A8R7Q8W9_TRIUA
MALSVAAHDPKTTERTERGKKQRLSSGDGERRRSDDEEGARRDPRRPPLWRQRQRPRRPRAGAPRPGHHPQGGQVLGREEVWDRGHLRIGLQHPQGSRRPDPLQEVLLSKSNSSACGNKIQVDCLITDYRIHASSSLNLVSCGNKQ